MNLKDIIPLKEVPTSDDILSEADRRAKVAILGLARHTLQKAKEMVARLEKELGIEEGKVS